MMQSFDFTRERARYFQRRLVRLHFTYPLKFFNCVAFLNKPLKQFTFLDSFTSLSEPELKER
jgi:hypothetical protein